MQVIRQDLMKNVIPMYFWWVIQIYNEDNIEFVDK
jgi:hypothetical protein